MGVAPHLSTPGSALTLAVSLLPVLAIAPFYPLRRAAAVAVPSRNVRKVTLPASPRSGLATLGAQVFY